MEANDMITEDDEGKKVVNEHGDEIGRVVEVRGGEAYVDPDPGIGDAIRSKLGWGQQDVDSYKLDEAHIDTITDDEIRLSA